LFNNKGFKNSFIFKVKNNIALNNGDNIRIYISKDNTIFNLPNPNTLSTTGICKSLSSVISSTQLGCLTFIDDEFFIYEISNFNSIVSGSTLEFLINDWMIKSTAT